MCVAWNTIVIVQKQYRISNAHARHCVITCTVFPSALTLRGVMKNASAEFVAMKQSYLRQIWPQAGDGGSKNCRLGVDGLQLVLLQMGFERTDFEIE
eukprot:SAG22_NODE_4703_length_1187_cov_1.079963_1_plen_96_part_10